MEVQGLAALRTRVCVCPMTSINLFPFCWYDMICGLCSLSFAQGDGYIRSCITRKTCYYFNIHTAGRRWDVFFNPPRTTAAATVWHTAGDRLLLLYVDEQRILRKVQSRWGAKKGRIDRCIHSFAEGRRGDVRCLPANSNTTPPIDCGVKQYATVRWLGGRREIAREERNNNNS